MAICNIDKTSPTPKPNELDEKSNPFKINVLAKHKTLPSIVKKVGFFFIRKNKSIGTTTQERFSKNEYLVGVVY